MFHYSVGDDMHLQHLHGASVFKDARGAAEEKLFDVLKEQIDQFMELSEYGNFDSIFGQFLELVCMLYITPRVPCDMIY